ncbi:dienelactone hydrolase [Pseudomassariella vexata]|uniref:Dienelactone hydrolase n=1 Tax=Pseudomassariella vexata TaxID=1141098 RepID=A0A1Y2DJ39_9PEZI|nr:dienelactone hydrolase [Pseudomassariella vexata]ORY59253.1 dienelactone hydrolase [Pseudomassariella vexata]
MDVNVPKLVDSVLPDRAKGRNARIIADNTPNYRDQGFLSSDFPRSPAKLYITAEDDSFDEQTFTEWKQEGFNVEYLPMGRGGPEYRGTLFSLFRRDMGPCEMFGIVAYGEAAAFCLEHFHMMDNNPDHKLGCLIAYYPTRIPDPKAKFPSAVHVLVHLPFGEVGVVKQSQLVGFQGKKRFGKRTIDQGVGIGGSLNIAYPAYSYDAEPGFAEHDMDEFDQVSAELAWSRTLATAKKTFGMDSRLEAVVENNMHAKFNTCNVPGLMSTYTANVDPHVTHIPTLTGGIGAEELQHFYTQFFVKKNPPSLQHTLISRTIGADRVVDEMHVTFQHTQEMPWILPGIPPTRKNVEIMIVSILTFKGGKIFHEHIYWDQASVLLQTGLLNPMVVPRKAKAKGVKRLPVYGWEPARKILEGLDDGEEGEADNELIDGFWDSEDENDAGEEEPIEDTDGNQYDEEDGMEYVSSAGGSVKPQSKEQKSQLRREKGKEKDNEQNMPKQKANGNGNGNDYFGSHAQNATVENADESS